MIPQSLKIVVALALTTVAGASQVAPPSPRDELIIKSIRIIPVPTSRQGLPDTGVQLQQVLARIPLVVESKLARQALLDAIGKGEKSIQSVYQDMGRSVRVEHETERLPSGLVELRFRVIELCSCDR